MKMLERVITPYNEVEVWQSRDGTIDFDVVGATHATWHQTHRLTGHAWDAITAGVLLHPRKPQSLLMLGLGGGTVLRQATHLLPDLKITAVEIDPEMVRLARKYMDVDDLNLDVIVEDAFEVLNHLTDTYDVVVDDLYKSGDDDVMRPAVVDIPMLELLQERVAPGGILASNFVIGKGHQLQHRKARAAFCALFDEVRAIRPPLSLNEVIVGGKQLLPVRKLKPMHRHFDDERDQRYWKELRTIKLR